MSMREIILDTETTGLDPDAAHRIVEIGAIEMVNLVPTGRSFHVYINPERPVPADSIAVHGLDDAFLADKPVFADIADDFLAFLGDSPLVIHNAGFDMGFINAELVRLGRTPLAAHRAIDTVALARKKFPGARVSLDALCRKFNIDNSHRGLHGAMIDTDLLAEVYIELNGGRQIGLSLTDSADSKAPLPHEANDNKGGRGGDTPLHLESERLESKPREPRPHAPSADELAAHRAFIATLKNPIWATTRYGRKSKQASLSR